MHIVGERLSSSNYKHCHESTFVLSSPLPLMLHDQTWHWWQTNTTVSMCKHHFTKHQFKKSLSGFESFDTMLFSNSNAVNAPDCIAKVANGNSSNGAVHIECTLNGNIVNNLIFAYKRQNYNDNQLNSIRKLSRLNGSSFIHDNQAHLLQIEKLTKCSTHCQ